MTLQEAIKDRILVLDGAMGTMIQRYKLTEADYRVERFKDYHMDIKGNNDLHGPHATLKLSLQFTL